jgi:hypothetical protein
LVVECAIVVLILLLLRSAAGVELRRLLGVSGMDILHVLLLLLVLVVVLLVLLVLMWMLVLLIAIRVWIRELGMRLKWWWWGLRASVQRRQSLVVHLSGVLVRHGVHRVPMVELLLLLLLLLLALAAICLPWGHAVGRPRDIPGLSDQPGRQ